jgi:hypothetical protein
VTGDDDHSVVRAVRPGDPGADPDGYDAMEQGWRIFFAQLRYLLEESPKGPRQTLYLTGTATGRQVLDALGGQATPLDSRVAEVAAEAGQLIVVGAEQPLDSPQAGPVQVVISTFGLDPEAFAEVLGRWAGQWPSVAEESEITVAPTS